MSCLDNHSHAALASVLLVRRYSLWPITTGVHHAVSDCAAVPSKERPHLYELLSFQFGPAIGIHRMAHVGLPPISPTAIIYLQKIATIGDNVLFCRHASINCCDAQNKPVWGEKTCTAQT